MKRYPGLDLLRAMAIVWVMLFHAMTEGLGAPLRPIGSAGWMAVDLFFVLTDAPALVPARTVQAFVVYAAASVAVGTLLYLGVERPFLLLRDRAKRTVAATPEMVAVTLPK
jgi:peptidoglycan/LPS O-acetylase OafA/YrhL